MKLFFSPNSPYVRKVLVTAQEVGLGSKIELLDAASSPINRDARIVAQARRERHLVTRRHRNLHVRYLLSGSVKIAGAGVVRHLATHAIRDHHDVVDELRFVIGPVIGRQILCQRAGVVPLVHRAYDGSVIALPNPIARFVRRSILGAQERRQE